ncbi:putative DNA-binding transcriptional regulator YafY [Tamaricihabitans halophyticus]|uniref:Putative DNA-binding transcriptional regulator YafY n=1 Tax=Tamaricihabitans halophyticus TaxID=1262583 RepID=A0A4R2QIR7_9PSEU|nr:YafY family protein [Tamaricihabitans halophyticus]TCP49260.1 putative DNA-binding transcriptional regulator YafY [Tamaricihabitans halophyticus]
MRASRLVSTLLLLQTRGRVTAEELAAELEVSVRTVYRDIEALSSAGVPVYAERGPHGGYRILGGYRTRLTGLTSAEAESLFLAGLPGPAAELGLGAVLGAAQLKLLAALPEPLREGAGRIQERFHLHAPGWFREIERPARLAPIADAVWGQRRLRLYYRRWDDSEVTREVCPLGLVLNGGSWYLVADSAGTARTYRVARVLSLESLDEGFERPAEFDLAGYWADWSERFARRLYPAHAVVRLSPFGQSLVGFYLGPIAARALAETATEPDAAGWVRCTLPVESVRHAVGEFLRFGMDAEVLEPEELRALLADRIGSLATVYGAAGGKG